ncbi:MAG: hypothetical protein IKP88_21395 [Lachnospiraceae bacterium]|nr:hypothetical protein [Lachnospiraceae bacterium]
MDKYRYFVVIEEIKGLLKQGKYEEALELTEGIDPKKIKDNYDCMILGEVFLNNGMLGKAKECYTIIYNRKKNRRVALELVNICIRLKKVDEAEKYFDDYRKMAPNDYFNYIFKYKIDRLKGKPLKEQAASLEKLKKVEFFDNWGYELAKLYHKMGDSEKCLKTCEDIIIWFGDGEAVEKAKALKAYYSGEITLKDLNTPKTAVKKPEEKTTENTAENTTENITDNTTDNKTDNTTEEAEKISDSSDAYENVPEQAENNENVQNAADEDVRYEEYSEEDFEDETITANVAEEEKKYILEENDIVTEEGSDIIAEDNNIISEESDNNTEDNEIISEDSGIISEDSDNVVEEDDEKDIEPEEFEEEYTEEDLSAAEADVIKELSNDDSILKNIKTVDREIGLSDDELAKQVEAVLREDSAAREIRDSIQDTRDTKELTKVWNKADSQEMTKVWNKADNKVKKTETDDKKQPENAEEKKAEVTKEESLADGNTRVLPKINETDHSAEENDGNSVDADNIKEDSPLLNAVERELGFVDNEEKQPVQKKGWFSRFKERHQKSESRKKDEIKKAETDEEKEIKEREELEKLRFIEKEKKKDKQKFLDHQKQLAKLASEKAMSMAENEIKTTQKDENGTKGNNSGDSQKDVVTASKRDKSVYNPKKMKTVNVPEDSIVAEYLKEMGKSLEDYFGFFACQKDIGEQIVKCLEQMLDKSSDTMNYCIIGEKGTGKKALVHGFARFMADCGMMISSQTVWTEASKVNEINLSEKTEKLKGRCLVINQAGTLEIEAIEDVSKIVEKLHKKIMVVITDYRRNIVELFRNREAFEEMFRARISIPAFNQDDLFDYVDYKVEKAGFVFDVDAYDLMVKRIKGIMRATDEGALARTEKYVVKTLDNAEQRNGEAYVKQTLEHTKHIRSNVIISEDLPTGI